MPPRPSDLSRDVIVIGGGVAGLTAAAALGRRGLTVTLLEARERLGGRIFTCRPRGWPTPVELGAQFVHGGNDVSWDRLRAHRIPTRSLALTHRRLQDGRLVEPDEHDDPVARVLAGVDPERMRGWSFADYLRRCGDRFSASDRQRATGFVEGFEAAPIERMSVAALASEALGGDEQFIVPGGYDQLATALERDLRAARVTVVRRAAVTRVAWSPRRVRVRAGGRGYDAAAVVVTVPLGVLQARPGQRGAIAFDPPLRATERVVARMGVGHVVRVVLRFDARRWRALLPAELRSTTSEGLGFIHPGVPGEPVWWSVADATVLTGWVGGSAAIGLARLPAARRIDRALASLARVLGAPVDRVRTALADWQTHDWSRDPFSRGAYSFTAAGADDAAATLREPIRDTVFFAGEATADGAEVGTVHGAMASGARAAREVLARTESP